MILIILDLVSYSFNINIVNTEASEYYSYAAAFKVHSICDGIPIVSKIKSKFLRTQKYSEYRSHRMKLGLSMRQVTALIFEIGTKVIFLISRPKMIEKRLRTAVQRLF